jgi:hypothetical protein
MAENTGPADCQTLFVERTQIGNRDVVPGEATTSQPRRRSTQGADWLASIPSRVINQSLATAANAIIQRIALKAPLPSTA